MKTYRQFLSEAAPKHPPEVYQSIKDAHDEGIQRGKPRSQQQIANLVNAKHKIAPENHVSRDLVQYHLFGRDYKHKKYSDRTPEQIDRQQTATKARYEAQKAKISAEREAKATSKTPQEKPVKPLNRFQRLDQRVAALWNKHGGDIHKVHDELSSHEKEPIFADQSSRIARLVRNRTIDAHKVPDDTHDKIIRMAKSGMDHNEISKRVQRSKTTTFAVVRKHNEANPHEKIPLPEQPDNRERNQRIIQLARTGLSHAQIAREMGHKSRMISIGVVDRHNKENPHDRVVSGKRGGNSGFMVRRKTTSETGSHVMVHKSPGANHPWRRNTYQKPKRDLP